VPDLQGHESCKAHLARIPPDNRHRKRHRGSSFSNRHQVQTSICQAGGLLCVSRLQYFRELWHAFRLENTEKRPFLDNRLTVSLSYCHSIVTHTCAHQKVFFSLHFLFPTVSSPTLIARPWSSNGLRCSKYLEKLIWSTCLHQNLHCLSPAASPYDCYQQWFCVVKSRNVYKQSQYSFSTLASLKMPSPPVRNTNIKKASSLKHPVRAASRSALSSFRARVLPDSKFSATER